MWGGSVCVAVLLALSGTAVCAPHGMHDQMVFSTPKQPEYGTGKLAAWTTAAKDAWRSLRRDRVLEGGYTLADFATDRPVGPSERIWASEMDKMLLRWQNRGFIDVTDHPDLGSMNAARLSSEAVSYPEHTQYEKVLRTAFKGVSEDGPRANLHKLTSFYTRHYRSHTGYESAQWLLGAVNATASKLHTSYDLHTFAHEWPQSSILLHIPGRNRTLSAQRGVTILGAHQDSTGLFPVWRAPGADDDASGTVTLIEALRVLAEAGWVPESDVAFHWYSAEEGGLLGSQEVAAAFEKQSRHVYGMLQQDMTGFVKRGTHESVGIVTDYVSPQLTSFVERLVQAYLSIPFVRTKTNYGASDHASWTRAHVPSAFAIEAYVFQTADSADRSPFADCNLQRIHVRAGAMIARRLTCRPDLTRMTTPSSPTRTSCSLCGSRWRLPSSLRDGASLRKDVDGGVPLRRHLHSTPSPRSHSAIGVPSTRSRPSCRSAASTSRHGTSTARIRTGDE